MSGEEIKSGLRARWRRLDHAQRFSIAAVFSVAACAILFGGLLNKTVHRIVRESDERQTASFVRHVISTEFDDTLFTDDAPIDDVTLGSRLLESLALGEVFRIKLYGRDGTILWSDEKELLGNRFPDNHHLAKSLNGEVNSVIETPDRTEHVFERGFDRVMETYIPIQRGGVVLGVVEIYRYPQNLFFATRVATWILWGASLGGGAFLYLIMVGVVRRINRTQRQLGRDLRRSADELAAEKSKLERILNAMGAGLVQANVDGRIQWANETAQDWFGGAIRLVGGNVLSSFCREENRCDSCPFGSDRPVGKYPVMCESKLSRSDGETRVYQRITTPESSIDSRGTTTNFLQLTLDVTDVRVVESQLRHADRMALTGQLAAGIAHQINNPVGIMLTTITHRLAKAKDTLGPDLERDLQTMERQCRRVDRSVRSLLGFSRLPAGARVPLDLRSIVTEAIELTEPRMKSANVRLGVDFEDRRYETLGDPNDTLQVVLNLVNNAIDAMPDGGDLRLALDVKPRGTGTVILLTVVDSGPGLPDGGEERVFEPFFTTKGSGQGTGLGLAVSRRIVDGMGGSIHAATGENGGAVFFVEFPFPERDYGA